jgi:hypothetical protein
MRLLINPAGDKGAHCHLRLTLEDRTRVESSEFAP